MAAPAARTRPVHHGSYYRSPSSHHKKIMRSTMQPPFPASHDTGRYYLQCRYPPFRLGHKSKVLAAFPTPSFVHLPQPSQTKHYSMERLRDTATACLYRRNEQQATSTAWQLVPRQNFPGIESSLLTIRAHDILPGNGTTPISTSL
jgi:hypothetical protein